MRNSGLPMFPRFPREINLKVIWGNKFGDQLPLHSLVGIQRKCGSSVDSALASDAKGPRFDFRPQRGKFRSPNTLSLVSFAGMTLDKCIVLCIGTLTGCPMCRESHPLCRLKNPTRYVLIQIWSFCAGRKPSCGRFFAHVCIEKIAFVDYLPAAQKIH